MLFDEVLLQTFNTDIWQATAPISAEYSAEVIFLFSAFGIPSNRIDTDNLTLCGHNLCGGESSRLDAPQLKGRYQLKSIRKMTNFEFS